MAVDSGDQVIAFDASQRRLTILTAEGREVRTIRLVKGAISGLRLMKDGTYLVGEPLSAGPQPLSPKILLKVIDDQRVPRRHKF